MAVHLYKPLGVERQGGVMGQDLIALKCTSRAAWNFLYVRPQKVKRQKNEEFKVAKCQGIGL
jgi:hypothetical protein